MKSTLIYLNPIIYLPFWIQILFQLKVYQYPILHRIVRSLKFLLSFGNFCECELVRVLQLNEFYLKKAKGRAMGKKREFLKVEGLNTYLSPFVLVYIERYLNNSKALLRENRLLKLEDRNLPNITKGILLKKQFPGLGHPNTTEAQLLTHSIKLISKLNTLKQEVVKLQKLKYNSTDLNHEKKLLELWNSFNPDEELSARVSDQWKDLGFQGNDPATDFRGMGMLGLQNLLHFSTNYPELSKKVLKDSQDKRYWYPLAIVGINITSYCLDLLIEESNLLNIHLFQNGISLEQFNEFYSYSVYKFNEYWLQSQLTPFLNDKPFTVMDFEQALELFKKREFNYLISGESTNLNEILVTKSKKMD